MKLTNNFTLEEMIYSNTAKQKGIPNEPDDNALQNIKELAKEILQPIRDKYNKPIRINSGYRSQALNKSLKGANNSDHLYGAAADICSEDNLKLFNLILSMIKNKEIKCRQLIWEYGTIKPKWVHISINHNKNKYKDNQIVYIKN